MYVKEFNRWNGVKQMIEKRHTRVTSFRERDVWWCSLGVNVGNEEDGKNNLFERPVLVMKKFNNHTAWILPMSTKMKVNQFYFHMEKESVLLSQLRFVSARRFNRFVKRISTYEFQLIRGHLTDLIKYD